FVEASKPPRKNIEVDTVGHLLATMECLHRELGCVVLCSLAFSQLLVLLAHIIDSYHRAELPQDAVGTLGGDGNGEAAPPFREIDALFHYGHGHAHVWMLPSQVDGWVGLPTHQAVARNAALTAASESLWTRMTRSSSGDTVVWMTPARRRFLTAS